MKKGIVKIGFGEYQVGRSIIGPTNLMLELESDGYVELDSTELQEEKRNVNRKKANGKS